jgi:hypothetical protein
VFGLAVICLLAAARPLAALILGVCATVNALLATLLGQWDE